MSEATFIVVMDLLGAEKGRMPRSFYRALKKLQDVQRLQKSVYLVTGVTGMEELVRLGRGCGFQVQAFQVCGRNMNTTRIPGHARSNSSPSRHSKSALARGV
jgi:hypothetical protein